MTERDLERFFAKVDRSGGDDACWLWSGATQPNGYSVFMLNRKTTRGHRASYEYTFYQEGRRSCYQCRLDAMKRYYKRLKERAA